MFSFSLVPWFFCWEESGDQAILVYVLFQRTVVVAMCNIMYTHLGREFRILHYPPKALRAWAKAKVRGETPVLPLTKQGRFMFTRENL
ncbi:hypothetical protein DXZ20_23880 [Leptolyngbyaceae cyanobacterium CCMR0081]|uniref:Uncharacterized protein n=1 Tax=Adonisia turfae CCMR0081 TaxID=2292702 RepID=A0A6M0RS81_9CYAN|nr:hypothetical protein [Adonisia turfae CCMR0081]